MGCKKKADEKKADPTAAKDEAKKTEPVKPEEPKVTSKEITYKVGEQEFKGYIATPPGDGPHPGVLVVHEWWGHNDYARSRARMLAEMGYVALAVDMYGDGKQAAHPKDAMAFAGKVMENKDIAEASFRSAMEALKSHKQTDGTKLAAIGYCFGGAVVLEMAKRGIDLAAVASFHGSLSTDTPVKPGDIKAKVFVAHGADDVFVKPEAIEGFRKQMTDAKVDFKFVAYEGAKHSFTNPGADETGKKFELPLAYNEAADKQSWSALTEMLAASFAK